MFRVTCIGFIAFTALYLLSACAPSGISRYKNIYLDKDTSIQLSAHPTNKIKVLYTGCGGMVINFDSFSILTDPFYSYTGFSFIWKKLATDKKQTDAVCKKINDICGGTNKINSVLIAHSHYDHLLDLPYLLNNQLKNQPITIIGSASTKNAISKVTLANKTFIIPSFSKFITYTTIQINEQINVTVIKSAHAPHFRLLGMNVKAMKGSIGEKGIKKFDTGAYKSRYSKWKEGEDYSFLIELKKEDRQKPFRIFIQSSSCTPPSGIPPFFSPTDSVDLAFIGVASANYTQEYPNKLLSVIKPKQVVLIHWEDFFRPYTAEPKIVRATRLSTFLTRYKKVMGENYATITTMPRQLVCYTFGY